MISKYAHGLQLLIIYIALLVGGLILLNNFDLNISSVRFATLLSIMTIITLSAYIIMLAGMRKPVEGRGIYLIAAIGGKFLAYLLIILIFWINGKNLSKDFIIVFFVLYLMLTLFLVRTLLKLLKNN